jgi:hypothetical protein
MSHIFLVEAPQIPTSERAELEKHCREALLDPDYTLVTNYEIRITVLERHPNEMLIVTADGLPVSEVLELRKRVDAALDAEKPEDKLIVVNYECLMFTVPSHATPGTYGEIADPEPEETKLSHEEAEALIRNIFAELTGEKDAEEAEGSGYKN